MRLHNLDSPLFFINNAVNLNISKVVYALKVKEDYGKNTTHVG